MTSVLLVDDSADVRFVVRELVARLRPGTTAALVLFSAHVDLGLRRRAVQAGADGVLDKHLAVGLPTRLRELLESRAVV